MRYSGLSITMYKIQPRHADASIADRLASSQSNARVNKNIHTLRRIFNLAIEPRVYLSKGQNPFTKLKQRKKAKKLNSILAKTADD